MTAANAIDVQQFINQHKFSRTQIVTLLLCFLIVAVDGFDTASIGFIAPAIGKQWALDPAHMAPVPAVVASVCVLFMQKRKD